MVDVPRIRKRRLVIVAALVVAVGTAGAWASIELPARAIEQAMRQTLNCLKAIDASGEGDPADCRQQAGAMLTVAHALPWTREAARREQAEMEERVLEDQLLVASVRDFDVELRDRAGRALVDLHRGEYPPLRGSSEGCFKPLAFAGAHELMVELASPQESPDDRNHALRAALLLGDWEAAGRIARSSAADHHDLALGSAIVACILGDRETAIAHLADLEDDGPRFDSTLVRLHCDLPHATEPRDIMDRESQPNGHSELGMTIARLALAQTDSQIELIERIGLDNPDGPPVFFFMRTRDELTGAGGPVIVAELEAGARRLAELAATAPLELGLQRPRRSLLWGGFYLASMAAAERLWRGQLDEARAIYQVARELAANEELRPLASLTELPLLGLHARLDLQEALRVARSVSDEQLAALDPPDRVMLRLQLALVYEQAGELDRAVELSTSSFETQQQHPQQPQDMIETGLGFDVAARFVHGALLFRVGREASLELEAPDSPDGGALLDGGVVFAYWWAAARADPAARADHRWRAHGHSKLYVPLEPWSLASAFEVLARSGPNDKRELWLDVVSSDIDADPLARIRARLSAAERLGDAAAAERWREREAALQKRLHDDRAAALYRLFPK
jgi:tetratricopeptide (TPR) repeat protein